MSNHGERIIFESNDINQSTYDTSQSMPEIEQSQGAFFCAGCGTPILDRSYLLMSGKVWHLSCLRCCACGQTLHDAASCFIKDGNVMCKEDYYRKYSARACAGCGCLIGTGDLIMRARDFVYHVPCFTCVTCRRALIPGERFSVDGDTGRLHCCNCWSHNDFITDTAGSNPPDGNIYELEKGGKSTRRKRKHNLQVEGIHGYTIGEYQDQERAGIFPPQKTKRMRTSFKHHQLRAMKNYFNINHNPDAKDLKQLAHETGLTKRVLQVWFQNARAKYRRGKGSKEDNKETEEKESDGDVTKSDEPCNEQDGERKSEETSNGEKEASQQVNISEFGASTVGSSPADLNTFSSGESYSMSPRSDPGDGSMSCWQMRDHQMAQNNNYAELETISRVNDDTNAYDMFPVMSQGVYNNQYYGESTNAVDYIPTNYVINTTSRIMTSSNALMNERIEQ